VGTQLNWGVVWQYRDALAQALLLSTELAAAALAIGGAIGLALAYMAVSPRRAWRVLAAAYAYLVRNTPLLLLVFVLYLVLPEYGIRMDAGTSFVAALSIVSGGYVGENLRAAFASLPKAYVDGAKAIGLTAWQRQVYVVLPIALRYALPALTNSAVAIFKDTSLASIIAVQELTFTAREISTNYFRVFEAWAAVAGIYLAVSTVMALVARGFERRMPRVA
jgi:polar amino acid transport system permease protein